MQKKCFHKVIASGELKLTLTKGISRIDELLDFASRENPNRGFLFVSKVLGKHIPVSPAKMRSIYDELASLCYQLDNNIFVIGMSETATGLGAGLSDSLAKNNPDKNVYYQHTTRHAIKRPIWFELNEEHSHATNHIMYQPYEKDMAIIANSGTVILVDDEATTGKTLFQLAEKIHTKLNKVKKIIIVTLANWLNDESISIFDHLDCNIEFVDLIKGKVEFIPNSNFDAKFPQGLDDQICTDKSSIKYGRIAIKMPYRLQEDDLQLLPSNRGHAITIIGTGEHLYIPFLLAEELEKQAIYDHVYFQSTTRSPILKGDGIKSKAMFEYGCEVEEKKYHFIYNTDFNENWMVICETDDIAEKTQLKHRNYREL